MLAAASSSLFAADTGTSIDSSSSLGHVGSFLSLVSGVVDSTWQCKGLHRHLNLSGCTWPKKSLQQALQLAFGRVEGMVHVVPLLNDITASFKMEQSLRTLQCLVEQFVNFAIVAMNLNDNSKGAPSSVEELQLLLNVKTLSRNCTSRIVAHVHCQQHQGVLAQGISDSIQKMALLCGKNNVQPPFVG